MKPKIPNVACLPNENFYNTSEMCPGLLGLTINCVKGWRAHGAGAELGLTPNPGSWFVCEYGSLPRGVLGAENRTLGGLHQSLHPNPAQGPSIPQVRLPETHTLIHTNPMSSPLREQSLLSKQGARRTPRVGARILWVWPDTGGSGSRKWSLGLTCTICKMKQLDVTLLTLTIYDSCLTHWGALLAFSRLYQALVATTSQLWEDFLSISSPCSMWSL